MQEAGHLEALVGEIAQYVFMLAWQGPFETYRLNFTFFASRAFQNEQSFVDAARGLHEKKTFANDCVGDARRVRAILEEQKKKLGFKTNVRSIFFYKEGCFEEPYHQAVVWTVTSSLSVLFELFSEGPIVFNVPKAVGFKYTNKGLQQYDYELTDELNFQGKRTSGKEVHYFDSDERRDALLQITYRNVATNVSRSFICRWTDKKKREMSRIVIWLANKPLAPDFTALKGCPDAPNDDDLEKWRKMFEETPGTWDKLETWYKNFQTEFVPRNAAI